MKVLVATEKPFSAKAVEGIRQRIENAGHEFALLEKYSSPDQLRQAVADADALIVRSDIVDEVLFKSAPNLKIVVRAGAGYDNIDLKAATAAGAIVENTPGQNANAVAELVIGLAIMAARNKYSGATGFEISGKRLGLQAFGQVSRHVAAIAKGFGMNVSAIDPYCPTEVLKEKGVTPADSIEDLYRNNDIVSIHIPATPETVGSIGRNLISLMPKGAVLINTARKEVINEDDLLQVLEERTDLKYFADVKPSNADVLNQRFADRVFFTPKKSGAQTAEANLNAGLAAADQIVAFFRDGTDRFRVN
ncbi:MAG: 3-phosphoglycerate dehydrogenase [Muribaculaceae bacterium]|nr:3-phosphoglycerate dehydrogenase [Muribaculaceae bacterium]